MWKNLKFAFVQWPLTLAPFYRIRVSNPFRKIYIYCKRRRRKDEERKASQFCLLFWCSIGEIQSYPFCLWCGASNPFSSSDSHFLLFSLSFLSFDTSPDGCCRMLDFFWVCRFTKNISLKAAEKEEKIFMLRGWWSEEEAEKETGQQTIMCIFGVIVTSLLSFVDSLVHCYLGFFPPRSLSSECWCWLCEEILAAALELCEMCTESKTNARRENQQQKSHQLEFGMLEM